MRSESTFRKKPRILGIGTSSPAHSEIRLEQALRRLSEIGFAETATLVREAGEYGDTDELIQNCLGSDLVILQIPHHKGFATLTRKLREQGVRVAVDVDDDYVRVSPSNTSYQKWGRHPAEVIHEGRRIMSWKAGEEMFDGWAFDPAGNRDRLRALIDCVREADYTIHPTFRCARVYRRWARKQYVFPNLTDRREWTALRPVKGGRVRMCWFGGDSHLADLLSIKGAIQKLLHEHPDVMFVIYGVDFRGIFKDVPDCQLEYVPWESTYTGFVRTLQKINPDFGICPLEESAFNAAKSPLKWQQFAAMGVPVIASNMPPYSDAVFFEQGADKMWTGLLADNEQSWGQALEIMAFNPDARRTIGMNGQMFCAKELDLITCTPHLTTMYLEMLNGGLPDALPEPGHSVRAGD